MTTRKLFCVLAFLTLAACDGESTDEDAGTDAGDAMLDCETVCLEKFGECGAPPTIAGMQCPMICEMNDPTQEQIACIGDTSCMDLMAASLGGDPVCDLTFPPPPPPPPMDGGPGDAGPADAGPADGGPADAGSDDAGTEDGGTTDGGGA